MHNVKIFLNKENKHYDISQDVFTQHETCENWEDAVSHLYWLS
jgi:hypothetical protein